MHRSRGNVRIRSPLVAIGVAAVVLVAPVLWLRAQDPGVALLTPGLVLRHAGVLLGLAGFAAFALNLVLGARLRPVERLCGGLDRMYALHRRLGSLAWILLVGHGLLIGASLTAPSIPSAAGVVLRLGWETLLGVLALGILTGVAALALLVRRRISHETFVGAHRLVGAAFAAGALHALLVPTSTATAPGVRPLLLGLALAGGAAFVYRSVLGRLLVPRRRYRVHAVNRLDPSTAEIVLRPEGTPIVHRPGQFVFLTVLGTRLRTEAHPFSVTSPPGTGELRLVVKALGDFTRRLVDLEPGPRALVEGPYGAFTPDPASPKQVWVAGGVGITPFLSMARALGNGGPRPDEVDLYYCTERAEEAHFLDELFEIADRHPLLRVVPIRKTQLGFITAVDIEGATLDVPDKEVLICGPPAMQANLSRQLRALGVPGRRIRFEDFGAF